MSPATRSFADDKFVLNLDGIDCGFLKSFEGGDVSAEVIEDELGGGFFVKKHLGQLQFEDVLVRMGASMEGQVYDWIASAWRGEAMRKDVAVLTVDQSMRVNSISSYFNAYIAETTIPTMDASSKDAFYLTLKLKPEYSRTQKVSNGAKSKTPVKKGMPLLLSNFKLNIDGLDGTGVTKIESFTVNQPVVSDAVGKFRNVIAQPGRIDFPNLKITLVERRATSWVDWHSDFVIKGNNGEGQEKKGSLVFLSPTMRELFRIDLLNLGIFRLTMQKTQQDELSKVVAELYCERMEFLSPTT